jgi:hypothetical protein
MRCVCVCEKREGQSNALKLYNADLIGRGCPSQNYPSSNYVHPHDLLEEKNRTAARRSIMS